MSRSDRRQFLKGILGQLAQVAGTVVVASTAVATALAREPQSGEGETSANGVLDRADRLAAEFPQGAADGADNLLAFLNGRFRNTPLGGFGNAPLGAFRNTPIGTFRNTPVGGFRNHPLGSFGNGGWPNGHWGGFHNGGWPNMGWRNW